MSPRVSAVAELVHEVEDGQKKDEDEGGGVVAPRQQVEIGGLSLLQPDPDSLMLDGATETDLLSLKGARLIPLFRLLARRRVPHNCVVGGVWISHEFTHHVGPVPVMA